MKKVTRMQILVSVISHSSSSNSSNSRHLPNRAVECGNAKDIPVRGHPAPQSRIAVHFTLVWGGHKDKDQSNHEGEAIANAEVVGLHLSELLGVKLVVEGEVDIYSHGKRPQSICWHEPKWQVSWLSEE